MRPRSGSPGFRLDHVAIGVGDASVAPPFLVGVLGGRRHDAGPGRGFRWWQWRYEGGGVIEILEPEGPPDGFLHRRLRARGAGVHHATFLVDDLRAAVARVRDHGFEVVGLDDSFPGWKEAFLHPKQAQGIVVQLAESHPAVPPPPGVPREWPFPAEPPDPPEPAAVVGLRLASASAARAIRQWGDLLGGSVERREEELVFAFPESPLRLVVSVDAGRPEGPLAIEVRPRCGLRLPEGPHPELGATFVFADDTE